MEKRWNHYFAQLRNKYNMRVSSKEPLVIHLDGKEITRNKTYNLFDEKSPDSFLNVMEKVVKHFTTKYSCFAIYGIDEVAFIFEEPEILINDTNDGNNKRTDDIISIFSQYFYEYFNKLNNKEPVYWHGKCFSIPKGKINSYIKYKSIVTRNVLTTYFLKRIGVSDAGKIKLEEKINMCKKHDFYERDLKEIINGILYYNGDRIDIEEFLKGNMKKIETKENNNNENNNQFIDLSSWN